ncbi:hypothetical protein NDU88_001455 [Pleurodeles waltl]|uniref:Uncharacterized protein n=1 Tax=Pleurodeles waltl TaxID=8319 RepID=A0AAV7Q629_PLEWA|nr:hypothetical protein NDU88_001444 [Pleurodeles waltl]KAJ1135008.1 hypothetical protein NDU88_001454 [Pleurodeles waltl]KAJ1135009.1 hypothetical protein NDU88_001455 [Pleurodeles waltl]
MWHLAPLANSGSQRNMALEADCHLAKQGEFTLFSTGHLNISLRLKTTHTHILQFASRFPQDSTQRSTSRPGRRRWERS